MARGESGRIVLEIDPSEKDELYSALKKDGLTLKEWFLNKATQYLHERGQLTLFGEQPPEYKVRQRQPKKTTGKRKPKA